MKYKSAILNVSAFLLAALASGGVSAAAAPLNTADGTNGITDLFSVTFDGALDPGCPGAQPYCALFGGGPANSTRKITLAPNPSGVTTGVPLGITPAPAAGSFLNLTVNGSNMTLAGGTVIFPTLAIQIIDSSNPGFPTNLTTTGTGMVLDSAPVTVPIVGGVATFQVDLAPALAVDFSAFSAIVTACTGGNPPVAGGGLCILVTSDTLKLDLVRYYFTVTCSANFASCNGVFYGQSGNNSILSVNLNSIDMDADGVAGASDNCTLIANANQRDTNADGYGNICDPDFNGDLTVNINDFNRLKARLNITPVVDVDTDLDGNGAVNINDFNRLKSFLGKPPGPSGLH
jgi:hypothetical protein